MIEKRSKGGISSRDYARSAVLQHGYPGVAGIVGSNFDQTKRRVGCQVLDQLLLAGANLHDQPGRPTQSDHLLKQSVVKDVTGSSSEECGIGFEVEDLG
jgi:hypothetical protein